MERRKIESPHQGMCLLQPQQVFTRGREKSQKSEDLDGDFQFFDVPTDSKKNCRQTLEKNAGFAGFFFKSLSTLCSKSHGTKHN